MRITIGEESLVVRSLLSCTSDMREEQTFRSFRCRFVFFFFFVNLGESEMIGIISTAPQKTS